MSTKKRKCTISPLHPPVVYKQAFRTDVAKKLEEARILLESCEWFDEHMPESARVKGGSVWEMIENLDNDIDLPDFFDEYSHDAPKFMTIVRRIRAAFATEDYRGYDDAGMEVFKFIPATPEMTTIFAEAYRNWMGEGCRCSNHFEMMERQMPGFWRLIEQDERVVQLAAIATKKK